jgi:hypothetical protein
MNLRRYNKDDQHDKKKGKKHGKYDDKKPMKHGKRARVEEEHVNDEEAGTPASPAVGRCSFTSG